MTEDFIHYLWKYKKVNIHNLKTIQGEKVEMIRFGMHNSDSGPDFSNAQVRIEGQLWAGNIEIHLLNSDWRKHKHQKDGAYRNVILHVVYNNDKQVLDKDGNAIPTLELKGLIDQELINNHNNLFSQSDSDIPCGEQLKTVDEFTIQSWINRLAFERLERKSEEIKATFHQNKNNWEETFYQYLFKYFGLKVNALPFELLAKNTSLKIIEKHHNLFTIEALLFGQAGYLERNIEDEYFQQLKKEYQFLTSKFDLTTLEVSVWKLLRLRPSNFPTLRIAQMANLLNKETRLFSKIIASKTIKEIQEIFKVEASSYWNTHYQFGKIVESDQIKKIGISTINSIIINVIVPFTFVYGKQHQNEKLVDKALYLLENIKPESNAIIKKWNELGVKSNNAMDTQSLIELKNNYCFQKKCLNCSIGNKILQK